jgi:hypothetical protein
MIGRLTSEQLEQIRQQEGDSVVRRIETTELSQVADRVPPSWIAVVQQPDAATAQLLMANLAGVLPRFTDYVCASISGAAIVQVDVGSPMLLLYFPNWFEGPPGVLTAGCWIGGVPSDPAQLKRLESRVGRLPVALKRLWATFSFMSLRDTSRLCSPDERVREFAGAPELMRGPFIEWDRSVTEDEFLSFATEGYEAFKCLRRSPDSKEWPDHIVRMLRNTRELIGSARSELDDLLADWPHTDWR